MASTSAYKNTANNAHRVRVMATEESFATGMKSTAAPIDSGFVRTMCNFNLKNDGEVLVPRAGYKTEKTFTFASKVLAVHSTGLTQVKLKTPANTFALLHYTLVATGASGMHDTAALQGMQCIVEREDGEFVLCTYSEPAVAGAYGAVS